MKHSFLKLRGISALSITAVVLLIFHVLLITLLRVWEYEPALSGSFQLATAILASACCFRASCKSQGAVRLIGFLTTATCAFWSAGECLHLYNKFYLRSADPAPSILLFIFFASIAPLCITVFQLPRKKGNAVPLINLLDGAQVLAVIAAGYLFYFYFSNTVLGGKQLVQTRLQIVHLRNIVLSAVMLGRALFSKTLQIKRLFAFLSAFLAFYTVCSWVGNQAIEVWGVPPGAWCDLAWTIPFALIAIAAAEFPTGCGAHEQRAVGLEVRNSANFLLEYLQPVVLPALVALLVYPVISHQSRIAIAVAVVSFACYVVRVAVAQFHRESVIAELAEVADKTKLLNGMLPVCAACKMIRDGEGTWHQMEMYIRRKFGIDFTHGICPQCAVALYPEFIQP